MPRKAAGAPLGGRPGDPSLGRPQAVRGAEKASEQCLCPDCGTVWPRSEWSCPGCRLSLDDLAAADAYVREHGL